MDFDSIRANLLTYLRNQNEFTDYDFEGSGMSVLLDILAYNTHYMGMYLNMVANEMYLDTAQLRNSVLSHAKLTNYVPTSRIGAVATVNIKVTPEGAENLTATTLTLPKYTQFISEEKDGINYIFSTVNANTATKANGSFDFTNISIKQGISTTRNFLVDGTNMSRRFTIQSANVDTSTLTVSVQASEANTVLDTYTLADDLTELQANSTVFFFEENSENGFYTIYFGDGVLGKALANDNIVIAKFLETDGEAANKVNTYVSISSIGGYSSNIIVTAVAAADGGAEKETVEQVRFRAPIHYTTQNRSVTKLDYETLLLKDYPNVDAIAVWGGEENDPPVYGKVYISLKPKGNYEITLIEKERIKTEIIRNRNVLTVFPEIIDPDYTYILTNFEVNYNPSLTNLDEDELQSLIRQTVLDYKEDNLQTFNSVFRKSKLARMVDNTEKSITSNSLDIYVQKRIEPTLNETKNYVIEFKMPLYKAGLTEKLYSYPSVTVEDVSGIQRNVFFEEVPESYSGIDSIEVVTTGTSYTEVPVVTITGDGSGATAEAVIVNGKLKSVTVTNRGINYTRASATVTGGGTGSGATVRPILEQKNGTLRTYYFKTNGEKVIVNSDAADIDYERGTITLKQFTPLAITQNALYDNTILTFNIKPDSDTLFPLRNQIFDIDDTDSSSISIHMIPEV